MAIRGIDKNFIFDSFVGLAIGIGIIVLSGIVPFFGVIGIPSVSLSLAGVVGRFLIIVVLASIVEELFFREFVLDFFDEKLKRFGIDVPFFIAAILSSVIFALFHLAAYGPSLSAAGGSFFTAAVMGMVFAYIRRFTKSNIGNILAHMVLNFWLITKVAIVVA